MGLESEQDFDSVSKRAEEKNLNSVELRTTENKSLAVAWRIRARDNQTDFESIAPNHLA